MSILVVAAHPDDEVLGCGGTIAKLSSENEVHILILGEGITSRQRRRAARTKAKEISRLGRAARAVAKRLGASSLHVEQLPDNRMDTVPLLEVVKRVEAVVEECRPEIIYTHHPGDLNIDHWVTFRAVMTATRPMVGRPVRDIYAYEVPSSTDWSFQRIEPVFRPNVFVDITQTIETKIQAMQCYPSESRQFPHPRSDGALRAHARRWGSVVGLEYAEAFELIRSIRP